MHEVPTKNKGIIKVRVGDLIDNPKNFRNHPEFQQKFLEDTIKKLDYWGFQTVYETNAGYVLIDGHARKDYLIKEYGEDAVIEVNLVDFTTEEADIALATADTIGSFAVNVLEDQASLLREIEETSGIDDFFPEEYLEQIMLNQFDEDDLPENLEEEEDNQVPSETINVKFTRDEHRRLCQQFGETLTGGLLAKKIVSQICKNINEDIIH